MLLAMAISVTVLMNDKGSHDDARITIQQITTSEACETWRSNMRSMKQPLVDAITGRKVAAVYFECTPVRPDELTEMTAQGVKSVLQTEEPVVVRAAP